MSDQQDFRDMLREAFEEFLSKIPDDAKVVHSLAKGLDDIYPNGTFVLDVNGGFKDANLVNVLMSMGDDASLIWKVEVVRETEYIRGFLDGVRASKA